MSELENLRKHFSEDEIVEIRTDSGVTYSHVDDVAWFSDYREICEEWLNVDLHEGDDFYRDPEDKYDMLMDKSEYFDKNSKTWCVVLI